MGAPVTVDPGASTRGWVSGLVAHAALLVASIAAASLIVHPAWLAFMAMLSGFAMVQIGYQGHDLGHGQVPLGRRARHVLGLLCWNLLLGVSLSFWLDKHRRHHVETHVPGRDPDLYALFGHGAGDAASRSRLHRAFLRRTPWLFWIATLFARAHYLVLSVRHAAGLRPGRRAVELGLIAMHHAIFVAVVVAVLGPRAVAFIAINLAVSGAYMGLAFATNHLGMPYAAEARAGRAWQAAHTRNVRTGRLGDYLLGGLNHQVEHHLQPTLPRSRLRASADAARAACASAGVPYHSVGLWQALCEVQRGLRREARAVAP